MSSLLRRLYAICLTLLIAGCSGGGCSSCAGGAIQPIRGGFPLSPERRIPHAMQVRLTNQGLRAIEAVAPDLFASFVRDGIPINEASTSCSLFGSITICPGGGCRIFVRLVPEPMRALELSFVPTDRIQARIRLMLETRDLRSSGGPEHIPVSGCLSGHVEVNTAWGSRPFIGLQTAIAIQRDTHAERRSYFRADLVSVRTGGEVIEETPGETIETDDIRYSGSWDWLINFFRGTIINQARGQLSRALGPIQEALAASSMPDPPGCPSGTRVDGNRCRYADNTLVPTLLGTDGQGNFGALLASITPGMRAPASYVIAAGDPMHGAEATSEGMTVNVLGAVVSREHNPCVPRVDEPPAPAIPEWRALRQNNVPGTSTPVDLGIGLAEDWLNHSAWHLWNAGLFCLGVNSRMSQQISTGLFSALPPLRSLTYAIFPASSSAAALAMRPQQPPQVRIGHGTDVNTDPLLTISFPRFAIDFYAWSEERYVRVFTLTTDLTVPMNLTQDAMGLRPTLGMVRTANTEVTNSQLIREMPASIASALDGLLGTVVGMFAGNIPAISLPAVPVPGPGGMPVGNINIQIPSGGIQGTEEGSSRFLGIFANLRYTRGGMRNSIELDTVAELERLPYDASVYEFRENFRLEDLPRFRVRARAPESFGHEVEYSYRVDGMTWSDWSSQAVMDIASPSFIIQGAHSIEVRARMAGIVGSEDREPARLDFTIDTAPPRAELSRQGSELLVSAQDDVADARQLRYAASFDGSEPEDFVDTPRFRIPEGATEYVVRVRDDSGNELRLAGTVRALTIRGGPSTDESNGCGCSTPGSRRVGAPGLLALATVAAIMLLRARRSATRRSRVPVRASTLQHRARRDHVHPFFWAMVPLALGALGCQCGGITGPADANCDSGANYCTSMQRCIAVPACEVPPGMQATGTPTFDPTNCTYDMSTCNLMPLDPLPAGMAGSFLDMAVTPDGMHVWLSSYSPGDPGTNRRYGDLIVGEYNRSTNRVSWQHVDGVPSNGEIAGDPNGWRGGIVAPGPDVGRWNSIALDAMGRPRVAYWDTTNDKLKFAAYDGRQWRTHVVDSNGHTGRYASLVLLRGDVPAIAYRATVMDPMTPGRVLTEVRYAVANSAAPMGPADWTVTAVSSAPTMCRASDCAMGQVCQQSTGRCVASSGSCAGCSATQACIEGTCENVYTSNWVEDFPPGALFTSLALDAMNRPQLVWYDRDRGNLMGARVASGTMWSSPFIIDGETSDGRDLGDRGAWASLAVASDGTWHIGYVDAYDERVLYARVRDGARMGEPEVVDEGTAVGTTTFDDGRHIIGDSIQVDLDAMGSPRMVYQDSSAGTLRLATRGTSNWTTSVLDMMGHTGYWARTERGLVATFWRDMQMRRYGVRVTPLP